MTSELRETDKRCWLPCFVLVSRFSGVSGEWKYRSGNIGNKHYRMCIRKELYLKKQHNIESYSRSSLIFTNTQPSTVTLTSRESFVSRMFIRRAKPRANVINDKRIETWLYQYDTNAITHSRLQFLQIVNYTHLFIRRRPLPTTCSGVFNGGGGQPFMHHRRWRIFTGYHIIIIIIIITPHD